LNLCFFHDLAPTHHVKKAEIQDLTPGVKASAENPAGGTPSTA
jgi:hypothetical protein